MDPNTPLHAATISPLEIIFKRVDGVDIGMDVYIPPSATKENPVPVLLWWHGGGLLQGTRKAIAPHMLSAPSLHNLALISADYRLAPQTRLPSILADAAAALAHIQTPAFTAATQARVDGTRVVLSGSSAGGWLALLAGTGIGFAAAGLALPRLDAVRGVAPIYPITDLLDPFWKGQKPVGYMDRVIAREEVEAFLDPGAKAISCAEVSGRRAMCYHYMIQEGILGHLLLDGTGIPEDAFSIGLQLTSGKFHAPPMYIVTGNQDGKVPHRQSLAVVAAAKHIKADVEYHEIVADHGFDKEPIYKMERLYQFFGRVVGN